MITTLFQVKEHARQLGYKDAMTGRPYQHSINPGSWMRSWMDEYEIGWKAGRET